MTTETARTRYPFVEVASLWGSWDERVTAIPQAASLGAGQTLGEATIVDYYGRISTAGGQPATELAAYDPVGQYVRIGTQNIQTKAKTYEWYGIVRSAKHIPSAELTEAGGGEAGSAAQGAIEWTCEGLAGILDESAIYDGRELTSNPSPPGGDLVQCYYPPIFNLVKGGDRSGSTHSSIGTYVFARWGTGNKWTAKQALEYIIALFPNSIFMGVSTNVDAISWSLEDNSVLDWELPTTDFAGLTVAEALNQICNPTRGLSWRVKVDSGNPVVEVKSVSPAEITIGGVTIPAASKTALDFDSVTKTDAQYIIDGIRYDGVKVLGAKPLIGISLYWNRTGYAGSGTLALAEDGWDASTDYPAKGDEKTWRRWKLNTSWTGTQFNNANVGLRHDLSADGSRALTAQTPAADALELVAQLPCKDGFTAEAGPRQKALVFMDDPSGDWKQVEVAVKCDGAGIILGNSYEDAVMLSSLARSSNGQMIITCAIREWAPLQVWSINDSSNWPREVPRICAIEAKDIEQEIILDDTVTGVSGGSLTQLSSDLETKNEVDAARAVVAAYKGSLGQISGTLSWETSGPPDTTYPPNTMINPLTVHGEEQTINAIINRVVYDYINLSTRWSAERAPNGIESGL